MRYAAAILAGGVGRRMDQTVPKQFIDLNGRPLITWTLRPFLVVGLYRPVVVAIHPDWLEYMRRILAAQGWERSVDVVPGGTTRQESAFHVIQALESALSPADRLLIHDAARCLVSPDLLDRCRAALTQHEAVTTAVPTVDTIARVVDGRVAEIPPRQTLHQVQTPQGFAYGLIREAHLAALRDGVADMSDDAGLVLRLGRAVQVVRGDPSNIKVSRPADLTLAAALLGGAGSAG
ncbi:MAG: 2-C-methyl-D-erythritol 4-phosphate cytidylyltransferase [Acidobacteria bacterium]|nr:2-C-methyl-D-erythritol 4-phosphate cytidylyltransferase [Acidobacteriota bacterium]